jgi:hypothetical protein
MSEKRRAFLALRGEFVPRVGERAVYSDGFVRIIIADFADDAERTVEVVRVSLTGDTVWTRFVKRRAQRAYGKGLAPPHRWRRAKGYGFDGRVYYNYGTQSPLGELRFG